MKVALLILKTSLGIITNENSIYKCFFGRLSLSLGTLDISFEAPTVVSKHVYVSAPLISFFYYSNILLVGSAHLALRCSPHNFLGRNLDEK